MDTKLKLIVVLTSILLLFQLSTGSAENNKKAAISTTEEIVSFWEKLLSEKLDIVVYDSEMGYWYVNRLIMVNKSFGSEAIATDSNGTPDKLTIHFSFNRWHNRFSPDANSAYTYENRSCGFKSVDDALASIERSDFDEANYTYLEKISRKMLLVYLLKNDAWVLEGGNDLFEKYIGPYTADQHNAHLFGQFLSVPVH